MMLFDYNYQNSFHFCSLTLKVINTDRDSIRFFFSDKMLVATIAVDERMIFNYSD